ncbi:hypothetical protein D9619_012447 [Psilocybe cf. subviscida]|uniref:DUF5648 domain-containing protein n=1 Tax=Psilocybe cf. subviscida TaxID=2480587 RepID=A0A8H5ARB9_9AGAR|nr:hypothetical protein D9619_012447 [Psilocybe cf. subviscida]
MKMRSSSFCVFSIILSLIIQTLGLHEATEAGNAIKFTRTINTCADPSLAETVFQAFRAASTVHVLNYRYGYEHVNTQSEANFWQDIQPAFRAWPTQQNFTVPLFQLATADRTQYIYQIDDDAQTPPVVNGFNTDVFIIGWVYDSQVCGSVPLMTTAFPAFTDHYYTISAFEHGGLVSAGWTDRGVVAFVLPLYNC